MRSRILLSLTLLAALGSCTYVQTQRSLDLYLQGQIEAERGDLNAALGSLSAAIRENPRMGVAFIARGRIYKEQGNLEEAATNYQKAVEIEPYNYIANFQLGTIYQGLKRFAEAIKSYQRALETRPLDPDANMNLALAFAQSGQPLLGRTNAELAVRNNPQDATAHANYAMILSQCGDHTTAIVEFKTSIELNGKQPEVYANLAQEYIRTGSYQQARNVLETARTLAPNPLVYDRLGAACYKLSEYDDARRAFNEALKLDPKYYSSLNGLGVVAMSQALTTTPTNVELAKEAIGFWGKSLELNQNQPAIVQLVAQYTPKTTDARNP